MLRLPQAALSAGWAKSLSDCLQLHCGFAIGFEAAAGSAVQAESIIMAMMTAAVRQRHQARDCTCYDAILCTPCNNNSFKSQAASDVGWQQHAIVLQCCLRNPALPWGVLSYTRIGGLQLLLHLLLLLLLLLLHA
jgi:hypothetical protein